MEEASSVVAIGTFSQTIVFKEVKCDFIILLCLQFNFTTIINFIQFNSISLFCVPSEHDDRSGGNSFKPSEIKRRVSFKTVRNFKGVNDVKVRAFLEDEDMAGELMQGEGSQRLSGEYRRGGGGSNRRKGSPIPRNMGRSGNTGRGGNMGGKLMQNPSGWYQVTINYGAKYDKDIIFKLLLEAVSPTVFIPNYYKADMETKNAVFFVDEYDAAEKISRLDRRLTLPDGFKMLIRVRGTMPQTRIDDSLKERMKLAMVKRYNQGTKALDLTKFHADPELTDIFCALLRPPIMSAAIDIIAENIPDLEALNLNDNKLSFLEHMKTMSTKLRNLKILYLGNNKVSRRGHDGPILPLNDFLSSPDLHAQLTRRHSWPAARRTLHGWKSVQEAHQRPRALCQVHRPSVSIF